MRRRLRKEKKRRKKEKRREKRRKAERRLLLAEKHGGGKKRKRELNDDDDDDDDEMPSDDDAADDASVSGGEDGYGDADGDRRDSDDGGGGADGTPECRRRPRKRRAYELPTRQEFERYRSGWLGRIPKCVKSRFREGGFSKWGKDWLPILELGPFDVEPGPVRDMWLEMFRNVSFFRRRCARVGRERMYVLGRIRVPTMNAIGLIRRIHFR